MCLLCKYVNLGSIRVLCGVGLSCGVCLGSVGYDCVCALCHVHACCVYTYMSVCVCVS